MYGPVLYSLRTGSACIGMILSRFITICSCECLSSCTAMPCGPLYLAYMTVYMRKLKNVWYTVVMHSCFVRVDFCIVVLLTCAAGNQPSNYVASTLLYDVVGKLLKT